MFGCRKKEEGGRIGYREKEERREVRIGCRRGRRREGRAARGDWCDHCNKVLKICF